MEDERASQRRPGDAYPKSKISEERDTTGRRKMRAHPAKIHGRRRYAPQDHDFVIWWYSDPEHDSRVISILHELGMPSKLSSGTPMKIGYKLYTRKEESVVRAALRRGLLAGGKKRGSGYRPATVFNELDFSIQEVASGQ